MELNVLVEAKKEYLSQLCNLVCPVMIMGFHEMYEEANKLSKGKRTLLQYQKLLKEVPNWNDHIVKLNAEKVGNTCSWFNDLLAAVFVSFVKILSSVRLKTENKKISIKLPTNDLFIHTCYINAAKDVYKDPYIFQDETNEYDRDVKLTHRFITCIENTVKELMPIQQILQTYMSQQGPNVDLNADEPVEDDEDPDINENENEEPESVPAPEPEVPSPAEPESEPLMTTSLPAPPPPEEVKQIPITGHQADDDVLFPDARAEDEKQKVV